MHTVYFYVMVGLGSLRFPLYIWYNFSELGL